jgi:uncharacterized damage-inducible protein DinB
MPENMKPLLVAALAVLISVSAAAAPQQNGNRKNGFRSDFLAELEEVQSKVLGLAEATPESKFAWRPGKGIRSIGEVYGHMAGGNYFLPTFLGVNAPADMPRDIESLPGKARMIAELRKSFDHVRTAATNGTESDLDRRVKMFGKEISHRFVYVRMLEHLHEHLGQAIAYSRMNNIVPPWSR